MNPNSQGMNLGTAHGKVVISTNVAKAMQQAQTDVQNGVRRIGTSLQSMGSQLSGIGSSITAWTAPIAAVGVAGLKTAGDFQASMKEIEARTGLTGEALENVRDQALDLGAATEFSSQQAANAYLQLLTAGLDVEQAMAALPNVLTAATASGEDLGLMADQVTNVMSSFGLTAEDTTAIVETMSRAAASSPASMAQIGEAMANAGSIAKSYGISLEDTSAIMAIFAQRGIRGSEASTKLGSMLKIMNSGTAESKAAWDALGTSLFDANGNAREFGDVIQDIEKGLEGKTEEEKATIIQDLAGSYGLAGINALLASDGIDAMRETMEGQQSAADVAAAKMGTFLGSLTSLRGSIETLMIHSFTPFMEDILTPFIKQLIDIVNLMSAWAKENPETTKTIAKIGAALVALGPILFIAGKAITLIGAAIAFIASPIGIVIAGITALGVAFMKDFGGIRSFVMPIFQQIFEWLSIIGDKIHLFVTSVEHFGLADAIKGIFGVGENIETQESLLEGLLFLLGVSRENAIAVVDFFLDTFNSIRDTITGIFNTVRPLIEQIVTFISNTISNIDWNHLIEIGTGLLKLLNPLEAIKNAFAVFGIDIGQVLRDVVEGATIFFQTLNEGGTVFDGLRAVFGDTQFLRDIEIAFNGIVTFVQDFIDKHGDVVTAFLKIAGIGFILSPIVMAIKNGVSLLAGALGTLFSPAILVAGAIAAIVLAAEAGYPGGIAQLLRDAATSARELAFLGLWLLNAAAQNVRIVIEGFIQVVIAVKENVVAWIIENAGLIAGLTSLVYMLKISGVAATVFNAIMAAGKVVYLAVTGALTGATAATTGLAASMMAAVGPILAIAAAIAAVVYEMGRFSNTVNTAQRDAQKALSDEFASGAVGRKELEDAAFSATAAQFGGGILGDAIARLTYSNTANAVQGNMQLKDNGGPGQAGMSYLIGKKAQPELFVPDSNGQFIPNFDKMMEGAGGINIDMSGMVLQGVRDYDTARDAGRGLGDGLMERLRSRGN